MRGNIHPFFFVLELENTPYCVLLLLFDSQNKQKNKNKNKKD